MPCWVPGGEAGAEASSTVSRPSENSEMQGSMRRKHLGFMRALFLNYEKEKLLDRKKGERKKNVYEL